MYLTFKYNLSILKWTVKLQIQLFLNKQDLENIAASSVFELLLLLLHQ